MLISSRSQRGITLLETIVFMVVVSVALGGVLVAYNESMVSSVDPAIKIKALEKAQATMDLILTRKFDENTPAGGVPACNSSSGNTCLGIAADSDYDDVGDFNGYTDNSDTNYPISVTVVEAGGALGLNANAARRINVTVATPDGKSIVLSAYKVNF